MSIYKEIKNVGIDLFVSYHPKVIQLKKESKVLHKELKSKGLSLMQCQELTAKQNGFHNWYNFIHLIKRHYQQSLDNVPFILTTSKELPIQSEHKAKIKGCTNGSKYLNYSEDNPILLGYDINFGHYKWQNDNSMNTHQIILGESIYREYDVYLANQTMKNKRSMVFLNGEVDNNTLDSLVKSAIENGRKSDLKLINFKNSSIFPDYEHKIQNNFLGSSGMLTETFFSMIEVEDEFKTKTLSLIACIMLYLAYKRDLENTKITLERIREIILLENIVAASQEKSIPSHIYSSLTNYLNSLSEKENKQSIGEILVKHEKLREPIDELLKILIDTEMFNNDEKSVNLDSLIEKNNHHIYIVQFSYSNINISKKLHILFLNSIKSSMARKLGSTIEGSTDQIEEKVKQNRNVLYVFIRSCYSPKGVSVLSAQARSLGLSFSFSYSSLTKLEELSSKIEAVSIIANTNTKIFSTLESDYQTVALLERYKNEVSEGSVLNINDNSLSININLNRRKKDHVWLVKRGYASQVSFDSPYEPISDISSKNISIRMKLEDPTETYDSLEKSD